MDKHSLSLLIKKYKAGQCSAAEIVLLHTWMEQLAGTADAVLLSDAHSAVVKAKVLAQIHAAPLRKVIPFRKWVAAAAVLLPIAGVLCWQLFKPLPVQWVSVRTGVQEVKSVQLPDGTTVWLNAATTLQYPVAFAGTERLIKINGEAFFDVKQVADKPFIVQAGATEVKVLGTSFNIRQWKDEPVKVMVASGKVQVAYDRSVLGTLTATQKLTYNPRNGHLTFDSTSIAEAKGWVNGEMIFNNASLEEVLWELEGFYGVHFSHLPKEQGHFNLHFNQHMTLAEKLDIIQKISIAPAVQFIPGTNNTYTVQTRDSKHRSSAH